MTDWFPLGPSFFAYAAGTAHDTFTSSGEEPQAARSVTRTASPSDQTSLDAPVPASSSPVTVLADRRRP